MSWLCFWNSFKHEMTCASWGDLCVSWEKLITCVIALPYILQWLNQMVHLKCNLNILLMLWSNESQDHKESSINYWFCRFFQEYAWYFCLWLLLMRMLGLIQRVCDLFVASCIANYLQSYSKFFGSFYDCIFLKKRTRWSGSSRTRCDRSLIFYPVWSNFKQNIYSPQ